MKNKIVILGSLALIAIGFWMSPVTSLILIIALGLYGWGSTPRKERKDVEQPNT
jgi:hypothetical protein